MRITVPPSAVILIATTLIQARADPCLCTTAEDPETTTALAAPAPAPALLYCPCAVQWAAAAVDCAGRGARLAELPDPGADRRVVAGLRSRRYGNTWVGANSALTHWTWTSGESLLYEGCVAPPDGHSFPYRTLYFQLTPTRCRRECQQLNYTIAALQGGAYCACGHQVAGLVPAPGLCTAPCSGDPQKHCGGYNATYILPLDAPLPAARLSLAGPGRCAALRCAADTWAITATDCSSRLKFICITEDENGTCSAPYKVWAGLGGAATCGYLEEVQYADWHGARWRCEQLGGRLVAPLSEAALDTVTGALQCWMGDVWVAGSRVAWTWGSGRAVVWSRWWRSAPRTKGALCLSLSYTASPSYHWRGADCRTHLPYVCQTVPVVDATTEQQQQQLEEQATRAGEDTTVPAAGESMSPGGAAPGVGLTLLAGLVTAAGAATGRITATAAPSGTTGAEQATNDASTGSVAHSKDIDVDQALYVTVGCLAAACCILGFLVFLVERTRVCNRCAAVSKQIRHRKHKTPSDTKRTASNHKDSNGIQTKIHMVVTMPALTNSAPLPLVNHESITVHL